MEKTCDNDYQRSTLRGLKGIFVEVEVFNPKIETFGLTGEQLQTYIEKLGLIKEQLQTDVELKLRLAGIPVLTLVGIIPVLTKEQQDHESGNPRLYISVNIVPIRMVHTDGTEYTLGYFCVIYVSLWQYVALLRDLRMVDSAITWNQIKFRLIEKGNMSDDIRKEVSDELDEFINDYLAENPKEEKESAPNK